MNFLLSLVIVLKRGFLDIETTGLDKEAHEVTVVGVYDDKSNEVNQLIQGQGLDKENLQKLLDKFDVIYTYNGAKFDLDFLGKKFSLDFSFRHVDLMDVCHDAGIYGGQKPTEKKLDIERSDEVEGCDGSDAVKLWKKYKEGDERALEKLLEYNYFDCYGLIRIYEELKANGVT